MLGRLRQDPWSRRLAGLVESESPGFETKALPQHIKQESQGKTADLTSTFTSTSIRVHAHLHTCEKGGTGHPGRWRGRGRRIAASLRPAWAALRRLRQANLEFEGQPGYIVSSRIAWTTEE